MDEFLRDNPDPMQRRPRGPFDPKDLDRTPPYDILTLLRMLLERVERLEKDMKQVKTKLNLP